GGDRAWSLEREVNPHPFVPATDSEIDARSAEIVDIQAAGLAQRLKVTNTKRLVIGISGGLDSTLALLVAARAFDRLGLDRKGIVGVTMPGFGTSGRTHSNAIALMEAMGVESREIPIAEAVGQHFADIGHDPSVRDTTYENSQARERTQILMDLANELGGMVLGTGDLSELALGWATYNGDHMSMYGVNASIPKTLAGHLVRWFATQTSDETISRALTDIADTPISPELLPADDQGAIAQKTEDLVGPYELHDFFLYHMLRFGFSPRRIFLLARAAFPERDPEEIRHWLRTFCRRFFSQQFKRSCLPDGPKVGSVCLSPRGDWRMPSDATASVWLAECDSL
ncbi:MAG: NAD(+) synthase, partial [Muribaculaceae bacterium]|nr:NAD(+) synthase [Muribaculaceae bacterium]